MHFALGECPCEMGLIKRNAGTGNTFIQTTNANAIPTCFHSLLNVGWVPTGTASSSAVEEDRST